LVLGIDHPPLAVGHLFFLGKKGRLVH
jgi:hypothetical protein